MRNFFYSFALCWQFDLSEINQRLICHTLDLMAIAPDTSIS